MQTLALASCAGVEEALTQHWGWVYQLCRRIAIDPALAEDAAQAVFIQLAHKAPFLDDKVRVTGWLYNTARNTAQRALRDERRRKQHERNAGRMEPLFAPTPNDPGEGFAAVSGLLDEALARVSTAERHCVVAFYLQERSQAEIAIDLGCTENAVKMRVARGLRTMRDFMQRRGAVFSVPLFLAIVSQGYAACASSVSDQYHAVLDGLAGSTRAAAIARKVEKSMFYRTLTQSTVGLGLVLAGGACLLLGFSGGGALAASDAVVTTVPPIATYVQTKIIVNQADVGLVAIKDTCLAGNDTLVCSLAGTGNGVGTGYTIVSRINSNTGATVWRWTSPLGDMMEKITVGKDSNVYLIGWKVTKSWAYSGVLHKLAPNGTSLMRKEFQATGSKRWNDYYVQYRTIMNSCIPAADGTIYIGGNTNGTMPKAPTPGQYDSAFLMKLAADGTVLWTRQHKSDRSYNGLLQVTNAGVATVFCQSELNRVNNTLTKSIIRYDAKGVRLSEKISQPYSLSFQLAAGTVMGGGNIYWNHANGPAKSGMNAIDIWRTDYWKDFARGPEFNCLDLDNERFVVGTVKLPGDFDIQDGDGILREHSSVDGKLISEINLGYKIVPKDVLKKGTGFLVFVFDYSTGSRSSYILKLTPPAATPVGNG